jgi:3-hydroxyacyl-CoA dehydrogenase/enoyl-CoA hydratase/3-hydroxybutyryl-CoA epimerase
MNENASKAVHWHRDTDPRGVVSLRLDLRDSGTNVLSAEVLSELERLLDDLASDPPEGVVFTSAKSGFIAGADVKAFTRLESEAEALSLIRDAQRVLDRIEALPCPTVALINGHCLGGGLELALACNYRVALDEPRTRIGLPEVKLGIHPGFGGTVRSIRLLGPLAAMDLMLTGRTIDAKRARRLGLVDHAVPERQLRNAVDDLLARRPSAPVPGLLAQTANHRLIRPLIAQRMRKQVAAKASPEHYPAPYALIDLWQHHADDPQAMYEAEARSDAQLIRTPTAQNLVRVFQLQTRLKALGNKTDLPVRHVHVVGGGLMGGDIAAWCAQQGLQVSVQDSRPEALARTVKRAAELFRRRFRAYPRLATAAMDRLVPDLRGDGLNRADVVIEAIFEDPEAKQTLLRDIEPRLKPGALIGSNTSTIPIETLAEGLSDPSRLVGLHFFNPVPQMPLLEVVRGAASSDSAMAQGLAFARHIDKLPLPVTSTPGFLVNRILMPYLLEAVILEQEGVPGPVIDAAARDFGMPMGPLELGDAVGLDIALHSAEIFARELDFEVPERLRDLVDAGRIGKKGGKGGFYDYKNGKPVEPKGVKFDGDRQEIQDRMVLRLINEAVVCRRLGIAEDADLVDAGVIFGTGFAPFRGGPLRYLQQHGRDRLRKNLAALAKRHGARFEADAGWDA